MCLVDGENHLLKYENPCVLLEEDSGGSDGSGREISVHCKLAACLRINPISPGRAFQFSCQFSGRSQFLFLLNYTKTV